MSIAVALVIGTIELLQVPGTLLDLQSPFFTFIGHLDIGVVGYLIVGIFLMAWGTSFAWWKLGRIEERYTDERHFSRAHEHTHGIVSTDEPQACQTP